MVLGKERRRKDGRKKNHHRGHGGTQRHEVSGIRERSGG
jgi:hypothetical protein